MLSVVLADDENKILLLLQKLIDWQSLGYEIAGTANDGLRALELVREKQPDLLITDVRMPGCSGIELIQRAKDLQPNLHFIIISGYRKFEYAQNALKYGVEDYLLKPIKQDDLGLRAHGGDQGADAPAAQIESLGALLGAAANHHACKNHEAEIQDHGGHNADLCC